MNKKQAKIIFESEIKDPYNQVILQCFGKVCSMICNHGEYNKRSRISEKSKKQEKLFCMLLEKFKYRLHSGKIVPAIDIFDFLSESGNGFDWIHRPSGVKISVKHSKNKLIVYIKNCISNFSLPENVDYVFITTTGSLTKPAGLYVTDFELMKPEIICKKNSSKLLYKINFHHVIHYVECEYTMISYNQKKQICETENTSEQCILALFGNVYMGEV